MGRSRRSRSAAAFAKKTSRPARIRCILQGRTDTAWNGIVSPKIRKEEETGYEKDGTPEPRADYRPRGKRNVPDDPWYRNSAANQNICYNQVGFASFCLSDEAPLPGKRTDICFG